MPKLRIYLDTSVINYLFAEHSPEKRDATRAFFETTVRRAQADVFISFLVPDEIGRTRDSKRRELLLSALDEYRLPMVGDASITAEAAGLADQYLKAGILPEREYDDALHVALATLLHADLLLSWNFKHLANVNREMRFNAANLDAGYTHAIRIRTPWEAIDVSA
jgi:predicted nucleic acid-binding protein